MGFSAWRDVEGHISGLGVYGCRPRRVSIMWRVEKLRGSMV